MYTKFITFERNLRNMHRNDSNNTSNIFFCLFLSIKKYSFLPKPAKYILRRKVSVNAYLCVHIYALIYILDVLHPLTRLVSEILKTCN